SFFLSTISLPLSNSDCERIFSKMNLIKSKTRNKLVIETVNGLLLSSQRVHLNCVNYEPSQREYN
ncbi:GSCOCG00011143001-RA-CDS, partial [Cotesia congregata]